MEENRYGFGRWQDSAWQSSDLPSTIQAGTLNAPKAYLGLRLAKLGS